ncbi:RlpA-like double-psi beta-barrel-protein domain-containing protein-containing protein [Mucor mucedo]|uniref:RlpA-like double-psi beta-barrel-protein domain-containing protein-containing protein n=1 Tax=Mucor mucedo TaxID=29922 RepID=UPI002220DC41|nr:RlpA-like double-psi beta-barrel-protein domain-containing protein-containing protein [Mucor mucedo]KAI7873226.1 RlpA-like double-psi beta-barrel-protein domain-containing protein-containing protein [Mucor mucedo]
MSRTLSLFTAVVLALSALSVAAPAATSTGSSSGTFTGTATWFLPATEGGSQGACGPEEDNDSPIVALNAPQYGNMNGKSSWCGKKIKITGPKGSVTATVNDACPECKHGDLDLTPILFKQVIGNMNIGVGKISWYEL